jgi:hypothetical protein
VVASEDEFATIIYHDIVFTVLALVISSIVWVFSAMNIKSVVLWRVTTFCLMEQLEHTAEDVVGARYLKYWHILEKYTTSCARSQ